MAGPGVDRTKLARRLTHHGAVHACRPRTGRHPALTCVRFAVQDSDRVKSVMDFAVESMNKVRSPQSGSCVRRCAMPLQVGGRGICKRVVVGVCDRAAAPAATGPRGGTHSIHTCC